MLLPIINTFVFYILISVVLRAILSILPDSLTQAFTLFSQIRSIFTKFTISLFRRENNFEINFLAVFILPFVILTVLYTVMVAFVLLNTEAVYINVWLIIAIIFLISFMAPTDDDVSLFLEITPTSVFIFILKLFLVFQIIYDGLLPSFQYTDLVTIGIILFPVSPYLEKI